MTGFMVPVMDPRELWKVQ